MFPLGEVQSVILAHFSDAQQQPAHCFQLAEIRIGTEAALAAIPPFRGICKKPLYLNSLLCNYKRERICKISGLPMNILTDSLAAGALAVLIAGSVPNPAGASEKALLNPLQVARANGVIVLAEGEKKSKHHVEVKVMLKGYDPVAYFKQGKAIMGNPSIRSTYDGVTYFFASKADKADFDKSPEKFKPQYGGFCANSMSKGRRRDIDPKVFRVYKDKLYVCTTPADLKEFSANLDTNISKADKNWLQIGPSTYNSETRGFEEPWPFGPERNPQ